MLIIISLIGLIAITNITYNLYVLTKILTKSPRIAYKLQNYARNIERREIAMLKYCNTKLKPFNKTISKVNIRIDKEASASYSYIFNEITLTTGLLDLATRKELRSTLAHEMGHSLDIDLNVYTRYSQEYFADYMIRFLGGTYVGLSTLLQKWNNLESMDITETTSCHPSLLQRLKHLGLVSIL